MSSEKATRTCTSKGCKRPIRWRPFKGSLKLYPEKVCKTCQGTKTRYGLTKPEWDIVKRLRKSEGGDRAPSLPLSV